MHERVRKTLLGIMAGVLAIFGLKTTQRPANNGTPRNGLARTGLEARPSDAPLVKAEWDLPVERNERVDFWIDFLRTEKNEETREWLERLGYYGPMIEEKLRERGMPEDLVFLAMAESGFDPEAYSVADASGLWQFIAETGERYGLEVSEYVDERNDPVKATDAALDYLQDLYDRFGSWYLAAAAYNTGENRVERILNERAGGQKGDEALYWQIGEYLPRETRDYVPLMLAVGHIAKDPAAFGFTNLRYQPPMSYTEVRVPGGTTLEEIAEREGVDSRALRRLNPHLTQGITPPDREWDVRIPTGEDDEARFGFA